MPQTGPAPSEPGPAGRRLRIGVDAHAIGERKTGNERFIANLIPALRARCDHDLVLYLTDPAAALDWRGRGMRRTEVRLLRPAHPLIRIPFVLPAAALRDRLDVLLVQYTAPPLLSCPVVTVVHDVAFWKFPEYFSRAEQIWMRRTIPRTMRRAAGIVTVSDFSRAEIAEVLGDPAVRVSVAPNGVDAAFLDGRRRPSPEEPPFFLALGNIQPRKNLATLLRAYRILLQRRPDTAERLVIVGQAWLRADSLRQEASDLIASGRVRLTGYLPDDEVIGLLQRATAFAYPSVYEGFGLPVVEAMAAGTPVVVGNIPVMREVAGDAALRVPPLDDAAWADALERVATDPELRADLIARGRRQVEDFTWDRSGRSILEALELAAGSRRPPTKPSRRSRGRRQA